jgi:hypothetical protein
VYRWSAPIRINAPRGAPEVSILNLSLAARICVLGQIALGAMALLKAMGSIYRISAATIVIGVILWVALHILLLDAGNRELRPASIAAAHSLGGKITVTP